MSFRPLTAAVVGLLWCVGVEARAAEPVAVAEGPPAETSTSTSTTSTTSTTSSPASVASSPTSASPFQLEGVTVASDNPLAAPVVTATLLHGAGTATATLWFRSGAEEWKSTPMASGPTGLCLVRLPDGLQLTGFSFFVEAKDGAGGSAAAGSRASPIDVPPATEGNAERVTRDARDAGAMVGPHPAFVMMALGAGVLAGAGAGVFGYDLAVVNSRLAATDAELAANPTAARRAELLGEQDSLGKAAVQDTVATVIFGVVAGVAVVTGSALLVVAAIEQ